MQMQDKSKCEKKKSTMWGCKCKTKASVRRRTLCEDANARQKQVWEEEEHYVGMQMQDKSKCEKKNTTWGCKCKKWRTQKLHEKERLPLLIHKEKNAPNKMTIEFMKGVQCAESTKPTSYTLPSSWMRRRNHHRQWEKKILKALRCTKKRKAKWWIKDPKKERKTREKKCKQKDDDRNCVKTKKHELNN
jgi:hypothetical protein